MTPASNSTGSSSPRRPLWRIEHTGAATSVGSSAWQSAASWVGLQKRFRKNTVPGLGDVPVTLSPCPEVAGSWPATTTVHAPNTPATPLLAPQRMARLLAAALVDLLTGVQNVSPSAAPWLQTVVLALPAWLSAEQGPAIWQQSLGLLQQQGGDQYAKALVNLPLHILRSGHTACFEALEQLNGISQNLSDVLLLAADSWMDLALLQPQFAANTLLTDKNHNGFIAGEAAAALWLHAVPDTTAPDNKYLVLHPPSVARSSQAHRDATREPNPEALTKVFRSALSHAHWKPEHVGCTVSDCDGTAWRASAELAATARALDGESPNEWQPVGAVGQVGAATGAVHWALAAQRLRHDQTAPNSALSWALDAGDLAAAVALERCIYSEEALAEKDRNRPRAGSSTGAVQTYSARFLNTKS